MTHENDKETNFKQSGVLQLGPIRMELRTLRRWFLRLNVAYALLLLGILGALDLFGESGIILSILLFAPAWGWCLPSIMAIPVCAIIRWRTIGIHLALITIILWWYMDFEFNHVRKTTPDVTIMSYNYGERRGTEFDQFADVVNPDVIVLVDAPNRSPKYKKKFPSMNFSEVGEFVIMSRYPILASTKAVVDPDNGTVIAARFDVNHPHRRFAVYAVHLPTPRGELKNLRSNRFGGMCPSKRVLSSDGRLHYRNFLENKFGLAKDLLFKLEHDPIPCIVVGDFNTPPHGVIYRHLRTRLTDCFNECGHGYGHTFPGDAKKLYAFRQPWLRLDYVFRDDNWETCDFSTETGRNSQHLAVAAKLTFKQINDERSAE